jgi:ABC-type glutathione transport system ATPase component
MVKGYDVAVVMEAGEVVEVGAPGELLQKKEGSYGRERSGTGLRTAKGESYARRLRGLLQSTLKLQWITFKV